MRCLTTHRPKSGARRRFPSALLVSALGLAMALGGACASGDESGESDMSAPAPAATEAAATQSDRDVNPSSGAGAESAESFGDEAMSGDMSVEEGPMAEEEMAAPSPASPDSAAGSVLAVPTALTPADIGRDIIYRATVTVKADNVAAATREAVAIVQGLGGIVFGQQTTTEPRPRASLTFKVLPADFPTALERLAGVGELVDQRVSTDDVTERIVDLESRIITAEASVDRLRKFLQEAVVLENVARLERELLDRETTLETLRGQLRTLRGQVDLATITLTIEQPPEVRPNTGILVTAWVTTEDGDPCLGDREIDVETGDTLRFCLEVENRGEAPLTDVRVRSEALRRRVDSFTAVKGGFDRIESGEILVAVLEEPVTDGRLAGRVATRGLNVSIGATATPVGADGAGLPEISDDSVLFVNVVEPPEPDPPPVGFTDAVGAGAGALVAAARVVAVIAGALLPFLPFIAAVAAGVWWLRRRSNRRSEGI